MRTRQAIFFVSLIFVLTACYSTDQDSKSEQNIIKDKIYGDQFNALNKAQQVENILLNSAQSRNEQLEQHTNY